MVLSTAFKLNFVMGLLSSSVVVLHSSFFPSPPLPTHPPAPAGAVAGGMLRGTVRRLMMMALQLQQQQQQQQMLCAESNSSAPPPLTFEVLGRQDATTTAAVLDLYECEGGGVGGGERGPTEEEEEDEEHRQQHSLKAAAFRLLAEREGEMTALRDERDAVTVRRGIEAAVGRGALKLPLPPAAPAQDFSTTRHGVEYEYVKVDATAGDPWQVATSILDRVVHSKGRVGKDGNGLGGKGRGGEEEGAVIAIAGLSGTGKGTTVDALRDVLLLRRKDEGGDDEDSGESSGDHRRRSHHSPKVATWSNGDVFRCYALLALEWWEEQHHHRRDATFDIDEALSDRNLAHFSGALSFERVDTDTEDGGRYDIRIRRDSGPSHPGGEDGGGGHLRVSDIQNTILKSPEVSRILTAVAERVQGEVIAFARDAVERLRRDGYWVLLEGREATVDLVAPPGGATHRFRLVLKDGSLIGRRRAAQRLAGAAYQALQSGRVGEGGGEDARTDPAAVRRALDEALESMAREIGNGVGGGREQK